MFKTDTGISCDLTKHCDGPKHFDGLNDPMDFTSDDSIHWEIGRDDCISVLSANCFSYFHAWRW